MGRHGRDWGADILGSRVAVAGHDAGTLAFKGTDSLFVVGYNYMRASALLVSICALPHSSVYARGI